MSRLARDMLLLMNNVSYGQRLMNTQPASLIGYWPLSEASGTVADDVSATNADGAYTGTVTLAQTGIGDGKTSALFAGGRVSLATPLTALNTAMDKTVGTLLGWMKVNAAAQWTDGTARFLASLGVDANNRNFISKSGTNNQIDVSHRAGGTAKTVNISTSALTWLMIAMTWDKAADQVKVYLNGTQQGATLTGLGTWVGALNVNFTAIGELGSNGVSNSWTGYLAHVALWKIALTPNEIAALTPAVFLT